MFTFELKSRDRFHKNRYLEIDYRYATPAYVKLAEVRERMGNRRTLINLVRDRTG
jgi:hypothetical protein